MTTVLSDLSYVRPHNAFSLSLSPILVFLTAPNSTFSNIMFVIRFCAAYLRARHIIRSQYIPTEWKNESPQISPTTKCCSVFANFLKSKWLISGRTRGQNRCTLPPAFPEWLSLPCKFKKGTIS